MQQQAAEARLNMPARAAETVIEIEMAERGVEVVPPQQADHPAAEPNAFGIACRAAQRLLRLGKFVDFLGVFRLILTGRRWALLGGLGVTTLGEGLRGEAAGQRLRKGEDPDRRTHEGRYTKH